MPRPAGGPVESGDTVRTRKAHVPVGIEVVLLVHAGALPDAIIRDTGGMSAGRDR